jgi:hypothetical protein
MDNKNLIKNGGKGTFFGNLLRGVVKTSKSVGIPLLDAMTSGNVSQIFKAISGDTALSVEDKEMLVAEMQKDIEHEREFSKRWESDNKQEHWLPKLIRPLVLANYTLLVDIVILNGIWGKPLEQTFLPLLLSLAATVTGGYFALREFGKTKKNGK